MIRIEKDLDSFSLYFKDHCFLRHTQKHPCITLGIGHPSYKESHGVYQIKEKIEKKVGLYYYKIESQTETALTIYFSGFDLSLHLLIKEKGDQIELSFKHDLLAINRIWLQIPATKEEHIYGCGEQFSELDLRGKKVPLWSEEQGIGRGDPKIITWILNVASGVGGSWYSTYHPQPTFVSTKNYFFHAEMSAYAEFDFSQSDKFTFYIWEIPQKIILGKFSTALETVSNLSSLLGRQPKLPEWLYDGMVLAIQGQGGKEKVESRLKNALEKGVKISAIWSQDWEGIYVTPFGTQLFWDWKWDGGGRDIRFPDFPAFVKEMRGKYGARYMGYINSFFNKGGDLYKEAHEKGYLVKRQDGSECDIYVTSFPAALIDLTNPEAYKWIKEVMKRNMIEEAGLSGWMSDFGEYLPPDAVLHSGEPGALYHNKYPVVWQKANYEALQEADKLGEIVFFTRAGYSGTSKYSTLVWAGDQLPTWSMDDGLASVIPAGLSLGICGIGYHHSDIGGYTTFQPFFKRSKEVFMRWAEHSAFTMVMRTHESNRPQINPQFDTDEEIITHLAKMTKVHVHLKPYLQHLSDEYVNSGIPPMRPLYLHYETDNQVHKLKYQYLFGRDLLLAPVIKKEKTSWKVYLPDDSWIHIWSHQAYKKGWHEIPAPIGKSPVFFNKNSKFVDLFKPIAEI